MISEKLALELDKVMLEAKRKGHIGTSTKMTDDRELLLCDFIAVKYGFLEKKDKFYILSGLGAIEMEANNDIPFYEIYLKEKNEKVHNIIVKVKTKGWELIVSFLSGAGIALIGQLKGCH